MKAFIDGHETMLCYGDGRPAELRKGEYITELAVKAGGNKYIYGKDLIKDTYNYPVQYGLSPKKPIRVPNSYIKLTQVVKNYNCDYNSPYYTHSSNITPAAGGGLRLERTGSGKASIELDLTEEVYPYSQKLLIIIEATSNLRFDDEWANRNNIYTYPINFAQSFNRIGNYYCAEISGLLSDGSINKVTINISSKCYWLELKKVYLVKYNLGRRNFFYEICDDILQCSLETKTAGVEYQIPVEYEALPAISPTHPCEIVSRDYFVTCGGVTHTWNLNYGEAIQYDGINKSCDKGCYDMRIYSISDSTFSWEKAADHEFYTVIPSDYKFVQSTLYTQVNANYELEQYDYGALYTERYVPSLGGSYYVIYVKDIDCNSVDEFLRKRSNALFYLQSRTHSYNTITTPLPEMNSTFMDTEVDTSGSLTLYCYTPDFKYPY